MRKPDFIIAGTQKAGTTWLRETLFSHPAISGSPHQIHFFDRNYDKGLPWYCRHFRSLPEDALAGEKSTEYFDTETAEDVAPRIAHDCPHTKVIVILREPIARAFSALKHMVVSGVEPLPSDPNELLFFDRERPRGRSHRYIERGLYARQLEAFRGSIPDERLLVLIFEEDIVRDPLGGVNRTLDFLGVAPERAETKIQPVNARQLSRPGIRLMHLVRKVPYARSLVWRLDIHSPFRRWQPRFSQETVSRLRDIYRPENDRLYKLLGRRIPAWEEGC